MDRSIAVSALHSPNSRRMELSRKPTPSLSVIDVTFVLPRNTVAVSSTVP